MFKIKAKMGNRFTNGYSLLLFFFLYINLHQVSAQPATKGYTCPPNQTTYPCQTYVFYRAMAPSFLDLASIGDLFSISRLMISKPSNISSPDSPLIPDQSLFVPIDCSCHRVNTSIIISYAGLNYTILGGDTFYYVSTNHFQNLTTYQSVEVVNPSLVPTNLSIGVNVVFPIFCKCPNSSQLQNQVNYLISYVFQPSDTIDSIASRFNTTTQSLIDVNGNNSQPFDTVFVPVSALPQFAQPTVPPVNSTTSGRDDRKGAVIGLGIGLALAALLLISLSAFWAYRESLWRKNKGKNRDAEKHQSYGDGKKVKYEEVNLMAEVSDYLDKYKVFGIDELRKATNGFDENLVIQGSVCRAFIDGELYAVKKMKWNAYEELKILQKVNHGNLVKLEGFCIDTEEANCYLVYEYIENGSLHSWLRTKNNRQNLNWRTRLRIAIDVANGLQYIHEHTRPRVVHKDIKSPNILLDTNMRAKIANFGLAKSGQNAITMHIVGTQGYMPPEYISDGIVSTKMDVFAFGVVLLELVSGREAIDEGGNVLWNGVDGILRGDKKMENLREWMDDYLVREMSSSMESVVNVFGVAVACLHRDPTRRPGMVDIVYALCRSDDFGFDVLEDAGFSPKQVIGR